MAVNVEIPRIFTSYTGGRRSVAAAGANLSELLTDLEVQHPGIRGRLVNDEGKLRKFINVYINDSNVRSGQELESQLTDGDVVCIIPAMAGGA